MRAPVKVVGPEGLQIASCEVDFRPGGAWRITHRGPDGDEHVFSGEYREIVRPERIVWTFEYAGWPGHVSVETLRWKSTTVRPLSRPPPSTTRSRTATGCSNPGWSPVPPRLWNDLTSTSKSSKGAPPVDQLVRGIGHFPRTATLALVRDLVGLLDEGGGLDTRARGCRTKPRKEGRRHVRTGDSGQGEGPGGPP